MCLQNKLLRGYLIDLYNITEKNITTDFLESITQLNIKEIIDFKELIYFKNLKEIVFSNIIIDNILFQVLSNLHIEKITFIDCELKEFEYFKNTLKYLCINNCKIDNISEISKFTKLDSLYLDELSTVDLKYLPNIKNITNLSFYNTNIINEDKLIILDRIENLCIAGTNIKNIDTLAYNESLKTLVIDKIIYDNNKEVVKSLITNGVNVINYMNENVESAYGL